METVQHGSNLYPFQFYYEDLSVFDFNCIEWHWHTELEFIYIESGTVTLWIGEDQFNLTEGNGIFINSLLGVRHHEIPLTGKSEFTPALDSPVSVAFKSNDFILFAKGHQG